MCGTYGIHEFQLPHNQCPEKFVCDVSSNNVELAQLSNCIDSINRAMMNEMTSSVKDIFYFCHIHQFMTGCIKLLRDGNPIQKDVDLPELGYKYNQPAEHNQICGTYGAHEFQLPHNEMTGIHHVAKFQQYKAVLPPINGRD